MIAVSDRGARRPGPLWARIIPVVLAAIACTLFSQAVELHSRYGLPLDDAWIHLSYARTFAEEGRWALCPGARASAGTSGYLWPALLALEMKAGIPATTAAIISGCAAFVVLVFFWVGLVSRMVAGPGFALLAGCTVALSGNLLWLSVSGMESVLALALAVAAIERHAACDRIRESAAVLAAAVTRTEGVVLGLALGVCTGWRARRRGARAAARAVLGCAGPALSGFAILLGLNLSFGGHLMSSTLVGRRWLINQAETVSPTPAAFAGGLAALAAEWWGRIRDFDYTLGLSGFLWPAGHPGWPAGVDARAAGLLTVLALAGLALAMLRRKPASEDSNDAMTPMEPLTPLLAYAALHLAAFAAALPSAGHAGRYQPEVLLLARALPFLGGAWLAELAAGRTRTRGALARGVLGFTLFALLCLQTGNAAAWRSAARSAALHIEALHVRTAEYVHDSVPAGARVAAFDIGALAWFSEHPIVDLSGLTDPAAAAALHRRGLLTYMRSQDATHLVLISPPDATVKMELARYSLYARRGEPRFEPTQMAEFRVAPENLEHFPMTLNAFSVSRVWIAR